MKSSPERFGLSAREPLSDPKSEREMTDERSYEERRADAYEAVAAGYDIDRQWVRDFGDLPPKSRMVAHWTDAALIGASLSPLLDRVTQPDKELRAENAALRAANERWQESHDWIQAVHEAARASEPAPPTPRALVEAVKTVLDEAWFATGGTVTDAYVIEEAAFDTLRTFVDRALDAGSVPTPTRRSGTRRSSVALPSPARPRRKTE